MPRARFGTDGLRGVANADLTPELATALGRAVARVLEGSPFVVGRDTRRSGPALQAALSAGLAAEGVDVIDLGVIPTSGVAYTCQRRGIPGAMVSASHNPFEDNGIKVFRAGGRKLSTDTEQSVERELDDVLAVSASEPDEVLPTLPNGIGDPRPVRVPRTGGDVGTLISERSSGESYREHLGRVFGDRPIAGLRVVLDCANGAASTFGPSVFADAGAEVDAIGCTPDGTNINLACGSTSPEMLAREVTGRGADLGLAFDGDADRVVAVDHRGTIVHGDAILGLFALDMAERGELTKNTVVVTVMTNLGFHRAMAAHGISVIETPVGDRHVLEALDREDLALGGESSGHIVFRRHATTGDGLLTGLALADVMKRMGRSLAELSDGLMVRVPQLLVNVPVTEPARLEDAESVWRAVAEAQAELGDSGRVLLRPSGTESLVRVMVEASTELQAGSVAGRLRAAVQQALGTGIR